MTVISVKQFIEAGVHFGHRTHRWSPKMSPYIFGVKDGIHIIDLRQSLRCLKEAHAFVREQCATGSQVLFVATKNQAKEVIAEEAQRCGAFYINERWLGGLMTNFNTVKQSITRLKNLDQRRGADGSWPGIIKKEAVLLEKQRRKLEMVLGGIKQMRKLPKLLFVIDCKKEHLSLKESAVLGIPVVAVVDSNCNPCEVDYPIPGNDDSIRAIRLYSFVISSAVLEGRAIFDEQKRLGLTDKTDLGDPKNASSSAKGASVDLSAVKDKVTEAAKIIEDLEKTAQDKEPAIQKKAVEEKTAQDKEPAIQKVVEEKSVQGKAEDGKAVKTKKTSPKVSSKAADA